MLSPSILNRYLNQPAKRCSRCGGEIFRLTPAGALCCAVCAPGESESILVARNAAGANVGSLTWQAWSEDFDGPLSVGENRSAGGEPSERTAAESRGVQGGGWASGVGGEWGGESQAGAWGAGPESSAEPFAAGQAGRIDPSPPVDVVLVVSPRLDWFASGSLWLWGRTGEIRDTELVAGEVPESRRPPSGVFRPLSQPYLGWLAGQIENARAAGKLRGQDLDDARDALAEICFAAFGAGIFGPWALDIGKFPRRPPVGYVGPGRARGPVKFVAEWTAEQERDWELAILRNADREKTLRAKAIAAESKAQKGKSRRDKRDRQIVGMEIA